MGEADIGLDAPRSTADATATNEAVETLTTRIARVHGCDRGTFTVCWPEFERGETCRCKEDAKAALAELGMPTDRERNGTSVRRRLRFDG